MTSKLLRTPAGQARSFSRRLYRLVEAKSVKALKRDPNGLWSHLLAAHKESSSIGITVLEAASLYTAVLKFRPRFVLELGSGLSTIVLGFAAKRLSDEGSPCEIHSWEESKAYCEDLLPLIPDCIHPFLTISVAGPVEKVESPSWSGVRFTPKKYLPYDLVFVDGPEYPEKAPSGPGLSRSFDADALDVLSMNPNEFVVMVDGRRQTVEALRELRPFGIWRLGRSSPVSIAAPKQRGARIRSIFQKGLQLGLGRSLLPHTFWFWFVPNASKRILLR